MTDFTLGYIPKTFRLPLTNGADYIAVMHRTDGEDWPGTLEAKIIIPTTPTATVWVADVDGAYLRWNIDKADVAPVIAARPKTATLMYVDDPIDLVWAQCTQVVIK